MASALVLKPLWNNGHCTYLAHFSKMSLGERVEVEGFAAEAGFDCIDGIWKPLGSRRDFELLRSKLAAAGHALRFDHDDDGPFDFQRLHLSTPTRVALEALVRFELYDLSGWCPVQADGLLDGRYFYFRARGSYWRFEWGGNEHRTRSPRWWHEEHWPSVTGVEAGYMSDENAIGCILKAVDFYRRGDNKRFMPSDPEYERTILDGWSVGAISLQIASIRLGLSLAEVFTRAAQHGVEVSYIAKRELAYFEKQPRKRLSRKVK